AAGESGTIGKTGVGTKPGHHSFRPAQQRRLGESGSGAGGFCAVGWNSESRSKDPGYTFQTGSSGSESTGVLQRGDRDKRKIKHFEISGDTGVRARRPRCNPPRNVFWPYPFSPCGAFWDQRTQVALPKNPATRFYTSSYAI